VKRPISATNTAARTGPTPGNPLDLQVSVVAAEPGTQLLRDGVDLEIERVDQPQLRVDPRPVRAVQHPHDHRPAPMRIDTHNLPTVALRLHGGASFVA